MDAALYLNHPYGRPAIGWRHEIEKLDRDDALAFYRRFYSPNNAIVVVAGDVTAEEVKADAEETYGKVAAARRQSGRAAADGAGAGGAAHRYARRSARRAAERQPRLPGALGHHRQTGRERGARCARPCARQRLQQPALPHLVVDKGIALNAGAYYSDTALDYAKFGVYGAPKPGVSLHDVEAGIDAVLADVIEHGVTADELERAKTRLIADAVYAQDNQATLGALVRRGAGDRRRPSNVRTWPDRIRAVTAEAVQQAARTWLDRRRSVTGYLVKSLQPEEKRS